jgi:hypothetical protein
MENGRTFSGGSGKWQRMNSLSFLFKYSIIKASGLVSRFAKLAFLREWFAVHPRHSESI